MQLIEEQWNLLRAVKSAEILNAFRIAHSIQGALAEYDDQAILQGVQDYEAQQNSPTTENVLDVKLPEYEIFREGNPARNTNEFQTRRVTLTPDWESLDIIDVLLIERLREVEAVLGFARLDAVGELTDPALQVSINPAPLSRVSPRWVPAKELRGEGIFLRFDERAIEAWENNAELDELRHSFFDAHAIWCEKRGIKKPEESFPGMRYALLHSFSHAFMRQLALEAGYSAASLKERIYARSAMQVGGPMAGVLIYTAAPDSEGTLGGLIGIGENEESLYQIIRESLRNIMLCAGDPLCAEREVDGSGRTVHAAACHACLFAPETSCERGNRFLDRSVLVQTIDEERSGNMFFSHITL